MNKVQAACPLITSILHLLQTWGFALSKHLNTVLRGGGGRPPTCHLLHLLESQEIPLQPNGSLTILCLKWHGFPQRSRRALPPLPAPGCCLWHLWGRESHREVPPQAKVRAPSWQDTWGSSTASPWLLLPSLHRVLGVQSMPVPAGGFGRAVPWLVAQPSTGEATWDTHTYRELLVLPT